MEKTELDRLIPQSECMARLTHAAGRSEGLGGGGLPEAHKPVPCDEKKKIKNLSVIIQVMTT